MKNTFIPREKLSKKARRAMDAKQRTQWAFPPVSRVVPNKKKALESKKPRPGDAGWGLFLWKKPLRSCGTRGLHDLISRQVDSVATNCFSSALSGRALPWVSSMGTAMTRLSFTPTTRPL